MDTYVKYVILRDAMKQTVITARIIIIKINLEMGLELHE